MSRKLRYITLTTSLRVRPRRLLQHLLIRMYDAWGAEAGDE